MASCCRFGTSPPLLICGSGLLNSGHSDSRKSLKHDSSAGACPSKHSWGLISSGRHQKSTLRSSLTATCSPQTLSESLVRASSFSIWTQTRSALGCRSCTGPQFRLQFARIVLHDFSHGARLEEGQLLRNAHRLVGIPGVLLHGQLDLGGPVDVPWLLTQAWPDATLHVIGASGHQGHDEMTERMLAAGRRFADAPQSATCQGLNHRRRHYSEHLHRETAPVIRHLIFIPDRGTVVAEAGAKKNAPHAQPSPGRLDLCPPGAQAATWSRQSRQRSGQSHRYRGAGSFPKP